MRILVIGDPYCPSATLRDAFARLGDEHSVTFADVVDEPGWVPSTASERRIREATGSPEQVLALLDRHDVLVVQAAPVTEGVLEAAPSVRLVCCVRGGPVNVDVAAATARGVPVATTPGKNADAVAELTIAFVIMLARRLAEIGRFVEAGGVIGHDNYEGGNWFGHDIAGHTLGLIGYGQVGRRVALRALAMGMAVASFDPFVAPAAMAADGVRPVSFGELLAEARFVSLHARQPATGPDLFGEAEFARMRAGSFFVNTARETLVDEEALFAALSSGHLAGAALDVLRPRAAGEVNPLLGLAGVVATPHIGGATFETLDRGATMVADEIERFAAGSALVNVINPAVLIR